MRTTVFLFIFLIIGTLARAQSMERKIVIENGHFYFTTIDEEFQIGSLHSGALSEPLKMAVKKALPAGRNFTDPINPFSWDISGNNFYAINFLMHPLNDRNESLKRLKISSLKAWGPAVTTLDMIMQGTDLTPFAYNEPYAFVIKRSSTLNNFFYDGIALNDSSYFMAIANNGEMSVWNFNGKEWKHSEVQNFPIDGYFSLFVHGKKVCLATNAGGLYEVSVKGISSLEGKSVGTSLPNCLLIVNKDDDSLWYLKNNDVNQHTPLNELIEKKAIRIF
ncbi:MAG TPA: hypothetical protein VGC65_01205 [Bacteroidia bacterium]|jgi:hypothetical protein